MFFLRAIVLGLLISWNATIASAMKYAVTVLDGLTGEILFAEDDEMRLHPAGITKLMTLYVAFEAIENGEIDLDFQSCCMGSSCQTWIKTRAGNKAEIPFESCGCSGCK